MKTASLLLNMMTMMRNELLNKSSNSGRIKNEWMIHPIHFFTIRLFLPVRYIQQNPVAHGLNHRAFSQGNCKRFRD